MNHSRNIAGIVLAGGRSTRMNGPDKALVTLAGATLLDRTIARLRPQVALVAVNSNASMRDFAPAGRPTIPDGIADFPGPLAGILAGLEWAATEGADHVATAACDTPFFPPDLVERLNAALPENDIAMASSGGRVHPVFALWPTRLSAHLRAHLEAGGNRSVLAYAELHRIARVDFPLADAGDRQVDPFFNINTPQDLAEAERFAEKVSP
ncbi:MAG: molybdenum cofactor guanylyltransferase MobA [Rhizobiaceae bacterium]|nr:molybdenum cofactor guanylyltransferase MobA [Rhizobiaceae bacterium]